MQIKMILSELFVTSKSNGVNARRTTTPGTCRTSSCEREILEVQIAVLRIRVKNLTFAVAIKDAGIIDVGDDAAHINCLVANINGFLKSNDAGAQDD